MCPCESGATFAECCEPILLNPRAAKSAEALMRSRFTAYLQHHVDHLLATWHPKSRPRVLHLDAQQNWLGLKIKASTEQTVEFVARYKIQGKGYRLHETSRFVFEGDQWFYLDGVLHQ